MSIIFDPRNMLKKIAPVKKIEKMLTGKVTVKRTALRFLDDVEGIDKKQVLDVALKTVKSYKARIKAAEDAAGEIKAEIVDDPKLLINRVQNEIVFQMHEAIRRNYKGKRARWLPSDADEPRPTHQTAYGKEYIIGEGLPVGDDGGNVEPGDDYGCRCGVEILDETGQLDLG